MPALAAVAMAVMPPPPPPPPPFSSSASQPTPPMGIPSDTHLSIRLQTHPSSTIAGVLASKALFRKRASSSADGIFCSSRDPRHEQAPTEESMIACDDLDSHPILKGLGIGANKDSAHNGDAYYYTTHQEQLHTHVIEHDNLSTQDIIIWLAQRTSDLAEGMLLHCLVIEIGSELDAFQANILVHMYGKFGALEDAHCVFNHMQHHNVPSWNTLMSAYMHQKCYTDVLELFVRMQEREFSADSITIKIALRSCAALAVLLEGNLLHHCVVIDGLESDISISNSLIHMYGKCGALKEARSLFDDMLERDEYTWIFMITACFDQGHHRDVLQLYRQMQQEKRSPNKIILIMALKACAQLADLTHGQDIHMYIMETVYANDEELASVLIAMYGKCRALDLASLVFERMSPRTLSAYNAMIAACVAQKQYSRILKLVQQMLADGLQPDVNTYSKSAQACQFYAALEDVRAFHSQVIISGVDSDSMMGTALVSMYAKCGEIAEAHLLLSRMKDSDLFTWNPLLGACLHHGCFNECIQLFKEMLQEGLHPDKESFSYVLPSCAHLGALSDGKIIHACMSQASLDSDAAMGSCLINMYGKCGALEDARCVFNAVSNSNVIHWTSMIAVYVQYGKAREALQLFHVMQQENVTPNSITFTNVFNACASLGALAEGRAVHAYIKDSELKSDAGLANALLHMYCKCGALTEARTIFENMVLKTAVSWNVLIAAYVQQGHDEIALGIFQQMQQDKVQADAITYVNVLRACAYLEAVDIGNVVYCCVIQRGLGSDVVFATTLISMYGACGALEEARWVFDNIEEHNIVSWTAIITVYVQQGCGQEAIDLFQQMRIEGWEPDGVTLLSVLGAYASLKLIAADDVIQACYKCNLKSDVMLGNALIHMYAKCGAVEDAQWVFKEMHERNVATWNTMISAYGQHGYGKEALELLQKAQQEGISPDEVTWVHCLSICAAFGALSQGKFIHRCITSSGCDSSTGLGNALLNMYGKCGAMEEALSVFNNIKRDVVSWNAILAAVSLHGMAKNAVELFRQMQLEGTKPDEVTFLGVLNACSHAGLVKEGCEFFIWMRENHRGLLRIGHYGCLIDLFGKYGHLDVAEDIICTVPVRATALLWMTLLGACRNHNDVERGERALDYVASLDRGNAAPYVLLSNIYASHGRWEDVRMLQERMLKLGLQKRPGYSMIEIDNTIHSFLPRDSRHPDRHAIYKKLEILNRQLNEQGYVPDTTLALQDVDEESKKFLLCHHSERLALALGLIKIHQEEPLLIVKNLRMCADCHAAFKFLSVIADRKITLRDASRFHCFKNGLCSCGDYW